MHPWISNRTTTSCDGTGTGTSLSHLCLRRRREPPCSKAWQSSGGSGSPSLCLRWGRVRRRGGSGPVAGRATPHRVLLRLWAAGAPSLLYCFSAGKWPSLPLRSCADAVVLPLRAPSWCHILAAHGIDLHRRLAYNGAEARRQSLGARAPVVLSRDDDAVVARLRWGVFCKTVGSQTA
jgi:hypothetical protein